MQRERMIGLESYQAIKTPEEIEEERHRDSYYNSLLQDYDPECGSFEGYKSWCRKQARAMARAEMAEDEEEEE